MAADRTPGRLETRIGRGTRTESRHLAAVVVHPRDGAVRILGGPDPGSFLRSVAKPFQTLALFRSGAVERYGLTDEQLAVMTASHAGEAYHHELVAQLLSRHGLSPDQLRCGIHPPFADSERHRRLRQGVALSVLGNNCSGKHAGMLLHARALGADMDGYLEPDHPVQQAIRKLLHSFTGVSLDADRLGIDGCGLPTYHVPLAAVALAFHRLGDASFLAAEGLEQAAGRLQSALGDHPRAFSGEGRLPYRLAPHFEGRLLSKEGAEGLFVIWGEPGVLVAKALDGHERGYRYLIRELLRREGWLSPESLARWEEEDPSVVRNVAGREVGKISVHIA